jgi:peptide/nickel transport system substrate-binding protein
LAGLGAAAWGLRPSPALGGKADDSVRWASDLELENVDSYFNSAREGVILAHHVWDSLIYRDAKSFQYRPLLATSWNWVDHTTLEATLRRGVRFHNGQPFSADDVVSTLNFVANPDNKAVTQENVNWIKHAEKLDDYTVRIHAKAPFPAAIDYLANAIVIYPHKYYGDVGPKGMNEHPVGTGPYKVTRVVPGAEIDMVRNDDYFSGGAKGKPSVGKLVFRTIPDPSTQVAELLAGTLDWIWRVPLDQANNLKRMPNLTVSSGETMRIGYVGFDAAGRSGKTPFTDRRVRQAVAHAIDRQAMVRDLVGGAARVVNAACYPSQFGCTNDGVVAYGYDPEKSKKLLAEAGFPRGFQTDLYAYRERPYAEAIIGFLRHIGIEAQLRFMKYSALRDKQRRGETAFYFMTWGSNSVNDVSAITPVFFGGGPDDYARDPEVIAWLRRGGTSFDATERKKYYTQALGRISAQAYWLPLFTYPVNYAYTRDLEFAPAVDEVPRFFASRWK